MTDFFNPHFVYCGVFLPNYLLSTSKISHGSKLLYRILLERVDAQGKTLSSISHVAQIIGDREKNVIEFLKELEKTRFIKIHWHPLDKRTFRCFFLRPAWIRRKKQVRKSKRGRQTKGQALIVRSKHSEEVCREYALDCRARNQQIRNLEGFIRYLRSSAEQDDEIEQYLARKSNLKVGEKPNQANPA